MLLLVCAFCAALWQFRMYTSLRNVRVDVKTFPSCELCPMTMTFKPNLDSVKNVPARLGQRSSRLKVIVVCPHTHTDTHRTDCFTCQFKI